MPTLQQVAKDLLVLFKRGGTCWTRGLIRRNREGEWCPRGPDAYSYCLIGGLDELGLGRSSLLRTQLQRTLPNGYVQLSAFNDASNWKTVRRWLTKLAKGE